MFLITTPILHILLKPTFIEHRGLNGFNVSWIPISMYYLTSFQNSVLTKTKAQKCSTKFKSLTIRETVIQLLKYFKLFITLSIWFWDWMWKKRFKKTHWTVPNFTQMHECGSNFGSGNCIWDNLLIFIFPGCCKESSEKEQRWELWPVWLQAGGEGQLLAQITEAKHWPLSFQSWIFLVCSRRSYFESRY